MRHWSARGVLDRNKALWAAFILATPAGRIYHVGDSGYGDGFRFREARPHGPFRLAILPIGAYEPRWFMRDQHMDPAESVKAFGSRRGIRARPPPRHVPAHRRGDRGAARGTQAAAARSASRTPRSERFKPGQAWEL